MEAKAKQDKVLEIKRLTTAIAALRSEMNKYEEQLEDCRWVLWKFLQVHVLI